MSSSQEPSSHGHHPSLGLYIGIWACLLVLTTLTFRISRIETLPKSAHLPAALLIATTKATLVALFFMHLKYSSGAMRMTMVLSVGLVLLLMGGIVADLHTRFPLSNSNESMLSGVSERSFEAREAYGPQPPVVHHEVEAEGH